MKILMAAKHLDGLLVESKVFVNSGVGHLIQERRQNETFKA